MRKCNFENTVIQANVTLFIPVRSERNDKTMWKMILYGSVLAVLLLLAFLSRGEDPEIMQEENLSAFQRPFMRMALWLHKKIQKITGRSKNRRMLSYREQVQMDLHVLYPAGDASRRAYCFHIRKMGTILMFLAVADLAALLAHMAGRQELLIEEQGKIARADYGAGEMEAILQANEGRDGEYTLTIGARQYSSQETETMAEEAFAILDKAIQGENRSLQAVSKDLYLPSSLPDYPFKIKWESSSYALVDTDGEVHGELLGENEKKKVTLMAKLSYEQDSYTKEYTLTVTAPIKSGEEKKREQIQEALWEAESTAASEKWLQLPQVVDGMQISWQSRKEDYSLLLFGLIVVAGVLSGAGMEQDLKKKVAQRERQLQMDYPQMISRFVLFLGAGLSVRNAFFRMAMDYQRQKQQSGESRFVYEEILLLCHELESSVVESTAYEHFGNRCRLRCYTKFCALLNQNQRKGNQELLAILQAETEEAFAERRNLARQIGEEAGTKLLFPMIMMLGITMIMIIIPAYSNFSM